MDKNLDIREKKTKPRFMLAALKSGSGKTTITCGIIYLLKRQGKRVASLKCGPDYIDPMFHRRVLGIDSGNIDTYFTDENISKSLMAAHTKDADITVVEGVMGFYDGLGGVSLEGSSYEIARMTKTPVILVVDGKGASVTLAALIKGILDYREDNNIKGVILNRVSKTYYDRIKAVIEKEACVNVLGFLPDMKELSIPSRHLGLIAPEELSDFEHWVASVADCIEENVDVEAIMEIAKEAEALKKDKIDVPRLSEKIVIAVARDQAFSFYYKENLELLKAMGAELVYFSPLKDKKLPDNVDCILLGGGYPEIYAKELSSNKSMLSEINKALEKGLGIIAECGGFMYLMKKLQGQDGEMYEMVGYFDGEATNRGKLCRFGYIKLMDEDKEPEEFFMKGHEFHRWDTNMNGDALVAVKSVGEESYKCMHRSTTVLAGYPHLFYYSNINSIFEFLENYIASV